MRLSIPLAPSKIALFVAAAFAVGAGCAGAPTGAASGADGAHGLPAYSGQSADQFDDTIEPHAVGLELENYVTPKNDLALRARAESADVVVRARVSTVTGETEGGNRAYQVTFKTVERLAGKRAASIGSDFTVRVDRTSPSLGVVRSMEGQLVGKSLIVFAKAFARPDGDRDIHFHVSADAADVAAAVKEAVILEEVK